MSETVGGKLVASIRESIEPKEAGQSRQFDGSSLGGILGNDEVAYCDISLPSGVVYDPARDL